MSYGGLVLYTIVTKALSIADKIHLFQKNYKCSARQQAFFKNFKNVLRDRKYMS